MAKVIKAAIIAVIVVFVTVVAIATFGPAGGALALEGIFGATAVTMYMTAFVGTLVAGGIGMLSSKGINASGGNFGTKVSSRNGAAPRQLIYGTARVGGTIVKMDTRATKNGILGMTIVVAGHECDGFDEVYFGETKLSYTTATVSGETVHSVTSVKFTNSDNDLAFGSSTLARFTFHDGSQTAVDGLASAGNPTRYPATAKFLGCSYFYVELVYDPENMPSIPAIWFVMRGKNIYDPRTSALSTTDAQRQNPALQIRDYLVDTTYGLKSLAGELNDGTGGGGFSSAANTCDQLVTLTATSATPPVILTTEKRYTSNGFSNYSASGSGLIESITTSCAGNVTYTNGKFNLFVGASQTPALSITDDNILSSPKITTQSMSGELFNSVKSIFINKGDNYQTSEVTQYNSAPYLAADTPSGEASANFSRTLELRYPFTTSETTAQRLQRISLDHQRQSTTLEVVTSLEFMKAQPNDWIYVTNSRLGYVNKIFEIQGMSMTFLENEGNIFAATSLQLQEMSASVFGFAYNSYSTPQPNSGLPVIGELEIDPPTIGTPVQVTNVEGQTAKINIKVVWTNAVDSAIQGTEIQFKKNGEADSLYVTATLAGRARTTAEIANVTVGVTYNIRVRHFSFDNVSSVYSSVANIAIAQPDTITNPSNLGVTTDKPFNIELSWTNPNNTNMRAVDVHFGTTTSYTPSTSNLVGTYYGDIGKKKTVLIGKSHGLSYDQNYYFKIRAVNIYGSFVESGGNPVYVTSPAGQMKRVTTVDVDEISANKLSVGVIDADVITVNNLNASKITTGQLTLTASAASAVKAGKSSYEDATTAGFFLGFTNPNVGSRVEGIYIGTSANGLRYDTAGGLVVSGNISATTGSIGGFTISATSIRDAADSFGLSSAVTGGDDIRFYAGATLANKANAPFRVTEAGVITATSGTFSGALSAASGTFTGALSGGTISIGSGNNIFKADSNGIYLGNATFGSAPFRVNPAGALIANNLTANNATLTSATVSGAITATSGSLSSLAVSGALTVGTSGKITGGTSTSFNTGVGFFLGYDSSAYKFSIGDASTNKNLTWDGTDIKIGGAQITAPDNPSVVIYDGRSGEPPSVTSARVLLTSDTNTFYLKQDYTERLRLQVSYPLGALTSGTVSGETAAINSTMAAFKFQVYYALTSSPTNFTQFGTDASSSRQTTTGGLISNYLVKTTNLGGGNFKAELQTKTQVRTAHPTLSGLSLGAVDDNYNLTETVEADLAGGAEYVFKVVVTVTNGSASSYPATGSPASNLVRSAIVNGFQPVAKAGYGYAVEAFYQPLTTYRDGSALEVVRLSHGNDTLEIAAIDRSGHPRLVMIAGRGPSNSPSNTLWSARMVWAKDHETYSVGSNGDYIIGLNDSGSHLFLGKTKTNPLLSELQISNGRVDVIGSLYVDGTEVTGGGGSGTITNVIAGTNLNGGGTSGAVTLNLDSTISGNHTFSNNLIISGNLTVNGTTTTVDTDNLNVKDKNITLNYSTGDSSSTANGAGITIQDAVDSSNNATILWNTTGDKFDFSHKLTTPSLDVGGNIAVTGTVDGVDIASRDSTLTTTTNTANSALSTANSATTTANSALSTANSATTTANAALPKAGGTMTGTLTMGSNAISSTGTISSGAITSTGLTVNGNPVFSGTSPQIFLQTTGSNHRNWQMAAQENQANAFEISSGSTDTTAPNDTYTPRLIIDSSGNVNIKTGALQVNGTTVIDASRNLTNLGVINGANQTSVADRIGNIKIARIHPSSGTSPVTSIDNLETFILSKTDGGYGSGTKPSGSDNSLGIISLQTHSGNYFTQLALSTQTNDLFIRSAHNVTSYGAYQKLLKESTNITVGTISSGAINVASGGISVGGVEVITSGRLLTNIALGDINTNKITLLNGASANMEMFVSGTGTATTNFRLSTASSNIMTLTQAGNLNPIGGLTTTTGVFSGKIEATQLDLVGTDNYIAYGSAGTAPSNGDYLRLRDVASGNDALQFYMDSSKLFSIDGQTGNAYHKGTISSGAITSSGGVSGTTATFTDSVTLSGSGIVNITKGLGLYVTNNLSVSGLIFKNGGGDVEVSGNLRINSGGLKIGTATVIDASRNISAGTISSGAISSTGNSTHGGYSSWTAGNGTGGIFMHYNSSNSYRGYFDWRTLQLGNNGANNILAGNTNGGGYFKFWVGATAISQGGGTSGINALTISAAGNATFSGTINSGAITSTGKIKTTGGELEFTSANHQFTTSNANNIEAKIGTTGAAGFLLQDSGNNFKAQMYGDGTSYGFLNAEWSSWNLKKVISGALYFNNNNTYYIQPESTSNFNLVQAQSYKIGTTTVIDASRNLTNIGSITATGNSGIGITPNTQKLSVGGQAQTRVQIDGSSTSGVYFTIGGANGATIRSGSTNNLQFYTTGLAATIDSSMNFNISSGVLQVGGTTVIDASRNLTNIGTISSGAITAPSFSGAVFGAASGAPDSTIWGISRDSYPTYGIFYDEGNPDKILYKWAGVTKFNINMETGALDTPSTISSGAITSTGLTANVPSGNGLIINSADVSVIQFNVANGGQKNWGFASTYLAAGDFGLYQSNSTGGNPITAGAAKLYFTSTGAATFSSTISSGAITTPKVILTDARYGIGVVNASGGRFDTVDSGIASDPLELCYYSGTGVRVGTGLGNKYLSAGSIQINGTTVIDASRNLTAAQGNFTESLQVGGVATDNSYDNGNHRLLFGGGNSDSVGNYYIGTNLENVGGNYSKLDLRWHTGIRMGAQASYGGIRFYNNEDLSSKLMSIGEGNTDVKVYNDLNVVSNIEINGQTVISSARALSNISSIGCTGTIFTSGTLRMGSGGGSTIIDASKNILNVVNITLSGRLDGSTIGTGDAGIQCDRFGNSIKPFRPDIQSGTADNYLSLGTSGVRWTQVFAVNGSIQTSDRNEKQDIEVLSSAEQRVAVAAKGLLRKFRWKDAVLEKGDGARIHFGIIAQDLQAAFVAEGLDAGRYGMFTSDTWNEDGVDKTRMGVRYSELLAFIISAI